jgi:hypothetical protein
MRTHFYDRTNKNVSNIYQIKKQIHEKAAKLRNSRQHNNAAVTYIDTESELFSDFPTDALFIARMRGFDDELL